MDSGHLASAALMAAGLSGTYAALGAYALFSGSAVAQRAIAATWLAGDGARPRDRGPADRGPARSVTPPRLVP
jgi:hypothetical protein